MLPNSKPMPVDAPLMIASLDMVEFYFGLSLAISAMCWTTDDFAGVFFRAGMSPAAA